MNGGRRPARLGALPLGFFQIRQPQFGDRERFSFATAPNQLALHPNPGRMHRRWFGGNPGLHLAVKRSGNKPIASLKLVRGVA